MRATFSDANLKILFPTDGAKLMMHRIVSNSDWMKSLVVQENMLNDGHRCGACHNVSDAKVRIMTKQDKEPECSLKV